MKLLARKFCKASYTVGRYLVPLFQRNLSLNSPRKPADLPSKSLVPVATTKMMSQIVKLQQENPRHIVMVRVGDFYEFYYEQADLVGTLLGITVVDKKFKNSVARFTGVPVKSVQVYVRRFQILN